MIELSERAQPTTWAPILLAARIGTIRTSAIAGPLGLSAPRVRAILAAMVEAGWLAPFGDRRGRRYEAAPLLRALDLRSPALMGRLRAGNEIDPGT